ncbi:MAG: DUF2752 domain-containing protein [Chthoniobacter sp.]|uniref:DUF2752 domain-containing protein n=1 Tax=Chthoniobacter sp. TaxID=2510640 RepID=UPI0032ADC1CB
MTSLLEDPRVSLAILGAGAAHVTLTAAGLGGWPCPFYHATGWPCPGCGLGRASVLLLRGEWRGALRLHAFAPVLLVALAVLGAGLVLRGRARERLRTAVRWLEEKAMLSAVLLSGALIYWLLRLLLDESQWQLLVS